MKYKALLKNWGQKINHWLSRKKPWSLIEHQQMDPRNLYAKIDQDLP